MERGRAAAARCLAALHADDTTSPAVLDDVTSAVQALADTIEALADRLAQARTWLASQDAESVRRARVELELAAPSTLAAERAARDQEASLQRILGHIDTVERGLPTLRARLDATVRALEALAAEVTRGRVSGTEGAGGLLDRSRAQLDETTRALRAWQAAVAEVDDLG